MNYPKLTQVEFDKFSLYFVEIGDIDGFFRLWDTYPAHAQECMRVFDKLIEEEPPVSQAQITEAYEKFKIKAKERGFYLD